MSWYKNCSKKEKRNQRYKQYYQDDKKRSQEMARDLYKKLSEKEKNKKRKY